MHTSRDVGARSHALCRSRAIVAALRNERAEALAAIDDPFALQLFVGALHGDEAHEQVFGERAERGQRAAGTKPVRSDLALHSVDDLLIERTRRGMRDGAKTKLWSGHGYC